MTTLQCYLRKLNKVLIGKVKILPFFSKYIYLVVLFHFLHLLARAEPFWKAVDVGQAGPGSDEGDDAPAGAAGNLRTEHGSEKE